MMRKSDFRMKCECGNDEIVIYSSVQSSFVGYYCPICECLHIFDDYKKMNTYDEDLARLRKEYRKER